MCQDFGSDDVKTRGKRPDRPFCDSRASVDRHTRRGYSELSMWTKADTEEVARRRLRKYARYEAEMERRREEARAHAQELATEIGEADESVKRIWGFGSAFDSRLPFRERSDIDLAVEGGSTLAWKISQRSRWKVDWIELSDQRESMVKAIVESGVLLYERS